MRQTIRFIDPQQHVLATAVVDSKNDIYSGQVELGDMPVAMRQLFEEYETIVNDQAFGLLDEIEAQIGAQSVAVQFVDGRIFSVTDLQIFPHGGTVSFKTAQEAADSKGQAVRA